MTNADKEAARYRRDYEWYKSIGRCVKCHKQPAEPGKTMCLMCLMDMRERKENRSPESVERHKQYLKERREKNRQSGICIVCGKEPVMEGKTYCVKCKERHRRYSAQRRLEIGMMPRCMMGTGEYCYHCGKPSNGEKLCPECLERAQKQMLYARSCRRTENMFEQSCRKSYEINHLR